MGLILQKTSLTSDYCSIITQSKPPHVLATFFPGGSEDMSNFISTLATEDLFKSNKQLRRFKERALF